MNCPATKADGTQCGQSVGPKGGFCLWHDPNKAETAKKVRARGAETQNANKRAAADPLPDFSALPFPETLADVALWKAHVAVALSRGELSPKRAHELTFTLRALKEALDSKENGEEARRLLAQVEAARAAKKEKAAGR